MHSMKSWYVNVIVNEKKCTMIRRTNVRLTYGEGNIEAEVKGASEREKGCTYLNGHFSKYRNISISVLHLYISFVSLKSFGLLLQFASLRLSPTKLLLVRSENSLCKKAKSLRERCGFVYFISSRQNCSNVLFAQFGPCHTRAYSLCKTETTKHPNK